MRPSRALPAPSRVRLVGAGALALALAGPPTHAAAWAPINDVQQGFEAPEAEAAAAGERDAPPITPTPPPVAEVDIAAMEAARQTAEAQALADAGDYDGAIALWSHLMATIPRTAAYAPRRASLLLSIVDAHARAYAAEHDPRRLRVAIDLLDRYLGELDPTDDENRIAVEGRRRELAARLGLAEAASGGGDDVGPRPPPSAPEAVDPEVVARRWTVAGGSLIGAGVLGLAAMGAGMILGDVADRDLEQILQLDFTAAEREPAKQAALAAGTRANTLAYAGGVIGGALTVAGALAVIRGRRLRLRPTGGPTALGFGVGGRF